MTYINLCRWNAVSAGVGDFVVGAADTNCFTPAQMAAVDGNVYYYMAKLGKQFEYGSGVYNSSGTILHRTTILNFSVSNHDTSPVNFASPPLVDVFPSPSSSLEQGQFPSGTTILFYQASAPTGWTKLVTQNDKLIRVVSGTGGVAGGTNAFSSVMAQSVVGGTAISIAQMPSHTHSYQSPVGLASAELDAAPGADAGPGSTAAGTAATTGTQGGGATHNHTITMDIAYIDIILAKKN